MKKVMMMIAMMAVAMGLQAQTKYHDVELNEAKGPVKKIVVNVMGMDQTINFSEDGKMQRDGLSEAVYDENGYLQSCKMTIRDQDVPVTYKWEDGKLSSQKMDIMGQQMSFKRTYNDNGAPEAEVIDMGGNEMSTPYTDYKYDDHGNWISRSVSMMGQTMTQTRTIEYYE